MSTIRAGALLVICVISAVGCTTVSVKKDPLPCDRGIRYWRPKPYLFIGPSSGSSTNPAPAPDASPAATDPSQSGKKAKPGAGGNDSTGQSSNTNLIKVSMEIKYLPDYNEEYSIKLRPGIGSGSLSLSLQDGWNLTSVNMQTDQNLANLITSISSLLGVSPGKGSAAAGDTTKATKQASGGGGGGDDDPFVIVDARPDVPLGFYEPIIATDPSGRKSLFGWRYVGFMPFAGCPVTPCVQPKVVNCTDSDLYGIVSAQGSLKFARLSEIQNPEMNWPYHWKRVAVGSNRADGLVAPPPVPTQIDLQGAPQGPSQEAILPQIAKAALVGKVTFASGDKINTILKQQVQVGAGPDSLNKQDIVKCVVSDVMNKEKGTYYVFLKNLRATVYDCSELANKDLCDKLKDIFK